MFTSIRFCRDINIGKTTVEEKHKWFVDVETGGLWGTLKFVGFILLPWENLLTFGAVRWKRDKNLRILPLKCSEVFSGIRITKELHGSKEVLVAPCINVNLL